MGRPGGEPEKKKITRTVPILQSNSTYFSLNFFFYDGYYNFFFYILLYYFMNVMIKTLYINSFIVVYVIYFSHS